MKIDLKLHWENIYETKTAQEVSWTQVKPKTSLELIGSFGTDKTKKIIDIGGGDSTLVDFLLDAGYSNITVLDISEKAIERAKKRLGNRADLIKWIVSDITEFKPKENYDIWHDRAVFHFLLNADAITYYKNLVTQFVDQNMILATFSIDGPLKCSGLEIKQYDKDSLNKIFEDSFRLDNELYEDHITPFLTKQNFIYCSFSKK